MVTGREGRSGSFEVVVNGTLAWSKLGGSGFPDGATFVESLKSFAKTGQAPDGSWAKKEEGGCVIA